MNKSLRSDLTLGPIVFFAIAIVGLFYVKWSPYYDKAFVAVAHHSIGQSILMGRAAAPPAFSWNAAVSYAIDYGNAIWKAMVLGLLLGSAVQALLPADWVTKVLGRVGLGSTLAGGLLAVRRLARVVRQQVEEPGRGDVLVDLRLGLEGG